MARTFAHDGAFFRRLAYLGARHGPRFWLKYSPAVFGVAFALALPDARRKVRATLRRVRGETSTLRDEHELYTTFVRYAQCLAEGLAVERPEARAARCFVRGEAELERALADGRGAVLATIHAGPWDAATRLLRDTWQREVLIVMQGETDAAARNLHDGVRQRSGARVVHVGAHPLDALPLVRALKSGALIAVQLDRPAPNGRSLPVELFGERAELPEGPFRLAALAGVPLIPLFAKRRGLFDYELEVHPALEIGGPRGTTLPAAAKASAEAIQHFIFSCPTQWFNF